MRDLTTWNKVRPGYIISFRYPTRGKLKLNTLLIFGINVPVNTKAGSKRHLRGMKLEERNRPFIDLRWVNQVSKGGKLQLVKKTTNTEAILKLAVSNYQIGERTDDAEFNPLRNILSETNSYRTYDYDIAKKYQVYFEPVIVPPSLLKELAGED